MIIQDQLVKDLYEAYQKAQKNLVDYRYIYFADPKTDVEPAPYHYEWSELLLNGTGHCAIEAFRESGKSQYVTRAYPLYCITYPSAERDYIVLIMSNATRAQNKLKEIIAEATTHPLIKNMIVEIYQQSGDVFCLQVRTPEGDKHTIRIEAYGKGASIRGLSYIDRRPKIVIIDDAQDGEDASSDVTQTKDWNWFLSDVVFLGSLTRIFMIANNLGEKCIIERVFAHAAELGFKTVRIPVISNDEPAWAAKHSIDSIVAEKENYASMGKIDIWMREKMCLSLSDESRAIKRSDFCYYNRGILYNHGMDTKGNVRGAKSIFITIDPAYSKKESADYRAIVVNSVNDQDIWFLIDVVYGRWSQTELNDQIFRAVEAHKPIAVGIEQYDFYEPYLRKEMAQRNIFFKLQELKTKGKQKEERIYNALQPRFAAHKIWFPDSAPWLAEMESELLSFTKEGSKSLHDDLMDALAYQEQIVTKPVSTHNSAQIIRQMAAARVDQRGY